MVNVVGSAVIVADPPPTGQNREHPSCWNGVNYMHHGNKRLLQYMR